MWDVFTTIIDVISPVRDHIVFAGVWYVVNHMEERIWEIDAKSLDWLAAFCGNDFFPYLTFVTTHWDCVNNSYYQKLERRLGQRKQQWKHFLNGGAKTYQHGKLYEDDGTEQNKTLDYQLDDERLSLQAWKMVSRHCQQLPASIPRVLQELIERTSLERITAARVLRPIMSVPPAKALCLDNRLETRPHQDQRPRHSLAEKLFQGQVSIQSQGSTECELDQTNPSPVDEESSSNENPNVFSVGIEAVGEAVGETVSRVSKDKTYTSNIRSGDGLSTSAWPNPLSVVDFLIAHGQPHTIAARSRLADDWNIHAGPNGSQVQNHALLREGKRRVDANGGKWLC